MIRADLHTHSQASPDGSLGLSDYRHMLASGKLSCIAITDHDRIDFARKIRATLGPQIIVGEEITTSEGEIIGLYLDRVITPGLSAADTVAQIREQGGLVYVPHPFETVRKGITLETLNRIAHSVDIVETYNGRSLQSRGKQAADWTRQHGKAAAGSSDAHGKLGWGRTYTTLSTAPERNNLTTLLVNGTMHTRSTGTIGRLYPKLNRLRGSH